MYVLGHIKTVRKSDKGYDEGSCEGWYIIHLMDGEYIVQHIDREKASFDVSVEEGEDLVLKIKEMFNTIAFLSEYKIFDVLIYTSTYSVHYSVD